MERRLEEMVNGELLMVNEKMKKWKEVRLEEIYLEPSRNGLYKPNMDSNEGYPVIKMNELFENSIITANKPILGYYQLTDKELDIFCLIPNDLIFSRTSVVAEGVGKCAIIKELKLPTIFESNLIRVRLNLQLCEPSFINYFFGSPLGRKTVLTISSGTNIKTIRSSDLKNLHVPLPPLPTQQRIAAILSAYDDLIENNRRRITLLEDSARLLYKEWFVKFQFPGHEKVKVKNGLPEGWERKKLGEIVDFKYGKSLKAEEREAGEYNVYGSSGIVGTHNKYLVQAPSIVIGRKGNVGSIFLALKNFYPIDTVYYIPTEQFSYYLYLSLLNVQFQNNDGAVPGLNREAGLKKEIIYPNDNIVKMFEEIVIPIYNQKETLTHQTQKLREARNILLPKLMNGTIEV